MLCDINDVELYLLSDFDNNDPSSNINTAADRIEYLITAVSANIETICNRVFLAADYDEVFDMDGSEVTLNQAPIVTVTTVEYGNPFGTVDRTELETTEYLRYDDIGVLRLSILARKAPQFVRVVYNAGYETVPSDINLIAVKEVVRSLNATNKDDNLKSKKLGKISFTYATTSETQKDLTNELFNHVRSI